MVELYDFMCYLFWIRILVPVPIQVEFKNRYTKWRLSVTIKIIIVSLYTLNHWHLI